MKINELRFKNLVEYKFGDVVEILMMSEKAVDVKRIGKTHRVQTIRTNYDEIKPIPLTEEWLLKFGWEWDIFYQGYFGHNYTMFPNYNGGWRISYAKRKHDYIVENIKYVHELQNLYWCLCGEELEIN